MPKLRIEVLASIPLPKKAGDAARVALKVQRVVDGFEAMLGQHVGDGYLDGGLIVKIEALEDDSPAPPTEPKPRRKRRQALGDAPTGIPAPEPGTRSGSVGGFATGTLMGGPEYPGPEIPESLRRPA